MHMSKTPYEGKGVFKTKYWYKRKKAGMTAEVRGASGSILRRLSKVETRIALEGEELGKLLYRI